MKATLLLLAFTFAACSTTPPPGREAPAVVATFSIVARDPETGDLGVAVQSKFLGVGSVVPWARADVGAVATQAFANTTYGPEGLRLLEAGKSPEQVIALLTRDDAGRASRQVGIVDARGRAASYTGKETLPWAGHVVGEGFACQGNILAGGGVVQAMAKAFRDAREPFPERLVAALAAGQAAGGDARGRQSAALLVVRPKGGYGGFNDRYIDLRVEDHPRPIGELSRLLALHRETFGIPPLPGELAGFEPEPEPNPGTPATPRGLWVTWVKRLKARDFEGLHALHGSAWREGHPFAAWKEEVEKNLAAYDSFARRAAYAGTKITGDRAKLALRLRGAPRPTLLDLVREGGEWRIED